MNSINLIRFGTSKPDGSSPEQVKVRMLSGDHIDTCKFVALKAGIIDETEKAKDNVVMTGD
jgi:magnesium-transporting ATPase (P-type)